MRHSVVIRSAFKSMLPFQAQLRQIKRKILPYRDNPSNSSYALQQGLDQIRLLRAQGIPLSGDIIELGSGWIPIIPLLFHCAGARKLILTDVERLMDDKTIARAKAVISDNMEAVAKVLDIPAEEIRRRLESDFTPDYHVPWDYREHPSASADIIISRAVLEHVRPEDLGNLLKEFGRILRPGGVMCHIVDNSDHWEHTDKSLSRVNFLRYEENWYWRLCVRNTQDYQNRFRHEDYKGEFRRHGWDVLVEEGEPDAKCLVDLQSLPLASRFRHRDPQDLAILTSVFVLGRAGSTAGGPSGAD